MFKRYVIKDNDKTLEFFVRSKNIRGGFKHEACMLGFPSSDGRSEVAVDAEDMRRSRYAKVNYVNRTWEQWSGQTVLTRLWEKLKHLQCRYRFFEGENPFAGEEPLHEDLPDPDELFERFMVK